MSLTLQAPNKADLESVRLWRNENPSGLRTPYLLTREMQEQFYRDVICNPNSPHRYWGIYKNDVPVRVGFGGITNIQWENRLGEISLIIDPALQGKDYGKKAVELLLDQAFNYLNLKTVCGECYCCNTAGEGFWTSIASPRSIQFLPNRKFWNGRYWDGLYFSIDADEYRKVHSAIQSARYSVSAAV